MNWGDAPGWAACLIAAGALWVSWQARRDGRASVAAAERSAAAAEHTLEDQRREAQERRSAAAEAARPRAELRIEYMGKSNYRLRNCGDATAADIVDTTGAGAVDGWPVPLALRPGEAHAFMICGDFETREPSQLLVTWDGQEEPVCLPVP
ncbi:hypothetical protein [Streptomyces umbrinus]|uniref:hypothetical protein n=1 Tax=Streptomyces umbrinus TaxID=67370 RepID=UPI003435A3FC